MIGKPQVKRKLGHEVQIYVCRFNVILDLSISGCNTLKLFKHDLTGKGHEFSDLAGRHLESCKSYSRGDNFTHFLCAVFVEGLPYIDYLTCVVYNFVENNFLTTNWHALISFRLQRELVLTGANSAQGYLHLTCPDIQPQSKIARWFHYSAKSFLPVCTGEDCYNLSAWVRSILSGRPRHLVGSPGYRDSRHFAS